MKEDNKLIAEFMGYTQLPDGSYYMSDHQEYDMLLGSYVNFYNPDNMKFNTSWNWLMPVVEKIETLETEFDGKFRVEITHHTCVITGNKSLFSEQWEKVYDVSISHDSKIKAVYDAVIQFITWWNQNHKK